MLTIWSIGSARAMPQTKALVSIEYVVASASINQTVDLNQMTKNFVDVEYHPDRFPGLIRTMADPKTVILLLTSGKLGCTGAKKESEVCRAVNNLHLLLEKEEPDGLLILAPIHLRGDRVRLLRR